jgi:hypothetical protein
MGMVLRPRGLVLLLVPTVALAALTVQRSLRKRRIVLPTPAVVLVDPPAPASGLLVSAGSTATPVSEGVDAPEPAGEDESFHLHGQVVDPNGRPVSGARLSVRTFDGVPIAVGRSEADGTFQLLGRGEGVLVVYAVAGERRGRSIVDDDTPPLQIVVAAPGRIHGIVVAPGGIPVEGAEVRAQPPHLDMELPDVAGFAEPVTRTDAAGRFDLEIPTPDAWNLIVTHPSHPTTTREAVQVLGGRREVVLTLSGAAVDRDGVELAELEAGDENWVPTGVLRHTADGFVVIEPPPTSRLLPGDRILTIDGAPVGVNPWSALVGAAGSMVRLEVLRPATGRRFQVEVRRDTVVDGEGC